MEDIVELIPRKNECETEIEANRHCREGIPQVVEKLVLSCSGGTCFDHIGPDHIPSKDSIIDIVRRVCRILFPGYFIRTRL